MSTKPLVLSRRRFNASGVAIAAVAAVAGIAPMRRAFAQEASPEAEGGAPGLPPIPAGAVVVAQGLWNPTNILFGADGTLYIAESGVAGGAGPTGPAATPLADGALPMGFAPLVPGQISALAADGTVSVLTGDLGNAVGLAIVGESLFVSAGGGSIGSGYAEVPGENRITKVDLATGEATVLAEIGAYEFENNPDGNDLNPNLYGMVADADGLLYVADAGGNTIYTVDSTSGEFSLFAVVPGQDALTMATPSPEFGPRHPVPTDIVIDADGLLHVSLLNEPATGPSILTYTPDGEYSVAASDLSAIVSLAIGPDGALYATQLSDDFLAEMPAMGSVIKIAADGSATKVVEGLFFPHGLAFDADGNLYVTVNSIISSPEGAAGQVIRIDGIATPM